MMQSFAVDLLHGLVEEGRRHAVAVLREPTGHDEALLADLRRAATPAECASALIAALTLRIGAIEQPSRERLAALSAGDRERLMLALCARLLGPEAFLVASCGSCGAIVEFTVNFAECAATRDADERIIPAQFAFESEDGRWTARLRPPSGADLERAARGGPGASRALILACVESLAGPSGAALSQSALPAHCEAAIADALLALDPAAETHVRADCPSCGAPIEALLDGLSIVQSALGGARRIYEEVFRMAQSYHWSEAEILSLPMRRRRQYLAIAEAAEARP